MAFIFRIKCEIWSKQKVVMLEASVLWSVFLFCFVLFFFDIFCYIFAINRFASSFDNLCNPTCNLAYHIRFTEVQEQLKCEREVSFGWRMYLYFPEGHIDSQSTVGHHDFPSALQRLRAWKVFFMFYFFSAMI